MAKYIGEPRARKFYWGSTCGQTFMNVRLDHLDKNAPLHCMIHHVDLSSDCRPPYAGVSYVWGSEADPDIIIVHSPTFKGSSPTPRTETLSQINITRNLSLALRSIRTISPKDHDDWGIPAMVSIPRGNAITLWADAVCINQADSVAATTEKQVQIPLMGVYSLADYVFIYLGPESALPPGAMLSAVKCMWTLTTRLGTRRDDLVSWVSGKERVDEALAERRVGASRGEDPHMHLVRNVDELCKHFDIPNPEHPMHAAVNLVLQLPWFKRVWTFQETFLARERYFYLGDVVITTEVVDSFLLLLMILVVKGGYDFGRRLGRTEPSDIPLHRIRIRGKGSIPTPMDLVSLLKHLRGSECKIEADMVFGLLGVVAKEKDREGRGTNGGIEIHVDYSKSVADVFTDVARQEVMNTGSLGVLGLSDTVTWWRKLDAKGIQFGPHVDDMEVPSWVPDWRGRSTHRWFSSSSSSFTIQSRMYIPGCTGTTRATLTPSPNPKELRIRGILFDTVAAIAPSETILGNWGALNLLFPTLNLDQTDGSYLPTNEHAPVAGLRTLCADLEIREEGVGGEQRGKWRSQGTKFLDAFRNWQIGPGLFAKILEICEDACLFATEGGKLGLAPLSVRTGDVICLALGGDVPLLLRRHEGADGEGEHGKYGFVGESYLLGFMDGEGLIEARKRADPSYDGEERDWLLNLSDCDVEQLPFGTTEICIC